MDQTNQFKVNQPTSSSPPSVAGNFLHVCKVNVQLLYFFYNYCPPLQPLIFSINILSFILIENWLLRIIIESRIEKNNIKNTILYLFSKNTSNIINTITCNNSNCSSNTTYCHHKTSI